MVVSLVARWTSADRASLTLAPHPLLARSSSIGRSLLGGLPTSLTLAPPPLVARYSAGYPPRSRSLLGQDVAEGRNTAVVLVGGADGDAQAVVEARPPREVAHEDAAV